MLPSPGFIEPCIRSPAKQATKGGDWIFEAETRWLPADGPQVEDRVRIYSAVVPTSRRVSRASWKPCAASR